MSDLTKNIQIAQVEAAEDVVVASLRAKGLMPPDPKADHERLRDAVVEAVKAWAANAFAPDQPLVDAIDALNKFEQKDGEQ